MEEDRLERKRRLGRERARRFKARLTSPEWEARRAANAEARSRQRDLETTSNPKAQLAVNAEYHARRKAQETILKEAFQPSSMLYSHELLRAQVMTRMGEAHLAEYAQHQQNSLLSQEQQLRQFTLHNIMTPRQPTPPFEPLTPFMRYSRKVSQSVWKEVRDKKQNLKIRDIEKIIYQMWMELGDEEKKQYTDEYEAEMVKFADALKEYHDSPVYKAWMVAKEKLEADARAAKDKFDAEARAAKAKFEAEAKMKVVELLKARNTVVEPNVAVIQPLVTVILPKVTVIQPTGGEEDEPPVEPIAIQPMEEEQDTPTPLPVKTKLIVIQPTEEEEDLDDGQSVKRVSASECDHSPNNEISSDAVVPDVNKKMSENELQQIPENELQQQGKEHRAKRRKLAKSSECFYEELQNLCNSEQQIGNDQFSRMILKAEEEMKENQKTEAQQQEIQDVQKQNIEDRKKEEDMLSEVGDQDSESEVSEAFQQARDLLHHLQLQLTDY